MAFTSEKEPINLDLKSYLRRFRTIVKLFWQVPRSFLKRVLAKITWGKRVSERNAAIDELSEEFGFPIDDLYSVSKTIDASGRSIDGTHFNEEGVDILTDSVVKSILNVWDNQ